MTQLAPNTKEMARRLLEQEMKGRRDPEELEGAINRVCAELHRELVNLVGPGGVHALIGCAVHRAKRDFPFLGPVAPVPDPGGCLRRVRESVQGRTPSEAEASMVAVLAHFLGLLTSFLGEELGLHPVRKIWPEVVSAGMAPEPWGTAE